MAILKKGELVKKKVYYPLIERKKSLKKPPIA